MLIPKERKKKERKVLMYLVRLSVRHGSLIEGAMLHGSQVTEAIA